ncbi:hypothetical protein [Xanthomonas arboricola]|uniref:hypothetical protein n=1 Tax=Xanthomonas arboricola TaxID=56448 RepID=UPI0014320C77|nr:hypothetical protein [Xanthomonas arboricola]CAD2243676.1 hypothetical protein X12_000657 [Xanthomonas arboricola]
MPILIVQEDRAPIHASLDDMHRNAEQFQTRLTGMAGPSAQEEDLSLTGAMQTCYQTTPRGPVRLVRLLPPSPFAPLADQDQAAPPPTATRPPATAAVGLARASAIVPNPGFFAILGSRAWPAILIGVATTTIAPCANFCKLDPMQIVDWKVLKLGTHQPQSFLPNA